MSATETSIPNKIVTIRTNEPPWMNGRIRKMIRQRKRLYRKAKVTKYEHVWMKFREKINQIVSEIRKSKKNYFESLTKKLSEKKSDIKCWWKICKQALKLDKQNKTIPNLESTSVLYENNKDKASILNYFLHPRHV